MNPTTGLYLVLYSIGLCIALFVAVRLAFWCVDRKRAGTAQWRSQVGAEILSTYLTAFEKDDALHEEQREIRDALGPFGHRILNDPTEFARFCLNTLGGLPQAFKPYVHLLF